MDDLRVGHAHLQQHAGKVGCRGVVGLIGDDFAAELSEDVAEHAPAFQAALVVDIENGAGALAERVVDVFRQRRHVDSGERIGGVDVVAEMRDLRRAGTDRQRQRLVARRHRCGRLHDRAPGHGDHRHLVDADQVVEGVDAGLRIGLGVLGDHLQHLAVDAAVLVDVVDTPLGGADLVAAEQRLRPCHRQGDAQAQLRLVLRERGNRGGDRAGHGRGEQGSPPESGRNIVSHCPHSPCSLPRSPGVRSVRLARERCPVDDSDRDRAPVNRARSMPARSRSLASMWQCGSGWPWPFRRISATMTEQLHAMGRHRRRRNLHRRRRL